MLVDLSVKTYKEYHHGSAQASIKDSKKHDKRPASVDRFFALSTKKTLKHILVEAQCSVDLLREKGVEKNVRKQQRRMCLAGTRRISLCAFARAIHTPADIAYNQHLWYNQCGRTEFNLQLFCGTRTRAFGHNVASRDLREKPSFKPSQ